MPRYHRLLAGVVLLLATVLPALAQPTTEQPEMADALRADGKIWVVVVVFALILAGLFYYLIQTDSKLKKLEKPE